MRVSTLTTSLKAASLASAVITGITAPSTLAPNSIFFLTLISENYIQSVADIAVAWGSDLAPAHPGALGPYSDSAYVSPSLSMLVLKKKTSTAGQKNVGKNKRTNNAIPLNRYLGPDKSNLGWQKNVTIEATVPAAVADPYYFRKKALLQVAVYSLWGSYHGPQVAIWDVEVMIGEETSRDVVSS
jgi:hypothetical protein